MTDIFLVLLVVAVATFGLTIFSLWVGLWLSYTRRCRRLERFRKILETLEEGK